MVMKIWISGDVKTHFQAVLFVNEAFNNISNELKFFNSKFQFVFHILFQLQKTTS